MIPKITEGNLEQHVHDYALAVYGDTMADWCGKCPYSLEFDDDLLAYKQFITWFAYKQIRPETGETVLDEFVERFVRDEKLAAKILQIKDLFYDAFHVLETKGKKIRVIGDDNEIRMYRVIVARAEKRRRTYKIMVSKMAADRYTRGTTIFGLIHPWMKNGTHKACGILTVVMPPDRRDARRF